jgi:hypothetical protein
MDLIRPLRGLFDPIVEDTSVVLDAEDPLPAGNGRAHGLLEYHGALNDGRMVLFGFYQHSAQRTVTAEMWVPDDVIRECPEPSIGAVGRRRQAWSYSPATDAQELARTIVAEVTTWLQSFGPARPSTSPFDPSTRGWPMALTGVVL